jgi:hypothetical protein
MKYCTLIPFPLKGHVLFDLVDPTLGQEWTSRLNGELVDGKPITQKEFDLKSIVDGTPADLSQTPRGVLIASRRAVATLMEFTSGGTQCFEARANGSIGQWYVIQVPTLQNCYRGRNGSTITISSDVCRGHKMFRLRESPTSVIFEQSLIDAIAQAALETSGFLDNLVAVGC